MMRKLAAALAIMMVALVFGFAVTQSMIVEAQSGVMVGLNWNGTYYSDVNFTTPAFTRVETNGINFSYGLGSPGTGVPVDNFSIRWTGVQNFPVTAVYRFTVFRDEDAELQLDGQTIIAFAGAVGNQTYTVDIPVTAGQHPLSRVHRASPPRRDHPATTPPGSRRRARCVPADAGAATRRGSRRAAGRRRGVAGR